MVAVVCDLLASILFAIDLNFSTTSSVVSLIYPFSFLICFFANVLGQTHLTHLIVRRVHIDSLIKTIEYLI